MKHSLTTGLTFGLTSAVVTTMGLMVGLHSGTRSDTVVLGGILSIAVADAFSDALGIHVSEEAEGVHTELEIWSATITTFLAKFLFALTFAVPVLLLPLAAAIVVSLSWGFFALTTLSYVMAKSQEVSAWKSIVEHVLIAAVVVVITHWTGDWVSTLTH